MLTKEQRVLGEKIEYTKDIESKDDIVLIHLTNFLPENGIIRTPKDLGLKENNIVLLEDKEYLYEFNRERDSIHFSCNGEVSNHSAGNWDGCKYAIIIPLSKCNINDFYGGCAVDFFSNGNVELPEGSYILCPQTEFEELKDRVGNNSILLGYEGEGVRGYANFMLENLGYQREKIGARAWGSRSYIDSIDAEDEKFNKIIRENRISACTPF